MACVTETAPTREAPMDGPRFGLATATFVVISSMIGTGVLTTSGFTVYFVGSNQLMLALWVVGGVLALCGALTLCELSAALPRSGGDYVFLFEAYGPLAAFLSGWVSFLIGFGGPIAASASAAAKYLLPCGSAMPRRSPSRRLPRRRSSRWSGPLPGPRLDDPGADRHDRVKIGILACWRSPAWRPAGAGGEPRRPTATSSLLVTWPRRWSTSRTPTRLERGVLPGRGGGPPAGADAPAILLGTAWCWPLPGLNTPTPWPSPTSGRSWTPENVNVIAPIASRRRSALRPSRCRPAVGGHRPDALASVSAYILTGPRVAYAMARAGQFPEVAGRLSARGAPAVATALQVAWSLVLLWTASFERILLYSGVGLAIFSMLTVAAVYVLRRRQPDLPRPFLTPGYPIVPAVYLVGTGLLPRPSSTSGRSSRQSPFLSIAVGVPVYYLWTSARRRFPR